MTSRIHFQRTIVASSNNKRNLNQIKIHNAKSRKHPIIVINLKVQISQKEMMQNVLELLNQIMHHIQP